MGRAPHAAFAYAIASQHTQQHVRRWKTDAIARPHLTTTPFAASLWETSKRALSSFPRRYAFTEDRSTSLLALAAGWKRRRTIPFVGSGNSDPHLVIDRATTSLRTGAATRLRDDFAPVAIPGIPEQWLQWLDRLDRWKGRMSNCCWQV
jgi:hypothetical protein